MYSNKSNVTPRLKRKHAGVIEHGEIIDRVVLTLLRTVNFVSRAR